MNDAKNVKCLVLDVDGVCTDGKLYYDCEGNVSKSFNAQDGLGIMTAHALGLRIAIITGRKDALVEARVKALQIEDYYPGFHAKLEPLQDIMQKHNLTQDEVAYVGDDWIDLDPMLHVAYPIAVANAVDEVKEIAKFVTRKNGGEGAVREAIEHIFKAQGKDGKTLAKVWMKS